MYYVNSDIADLYRVKFHDLRGEILRLDMNENPKGLPAEFVEEIKKKITPEFLAAYPEKDGLIGLIARHNCVEAACISLTSGSDEAMRLAFQCFGERGKKVVTVSPTFEMYDVYSKMFGMRHAQVPYRDDFSVSAEDIFDAIDHETGMVILLNPNSPIGSAYTAEDVRKIIEKARECQALVVIDEAYHYFYQPSFMELIQECDNVLILRTFSKLCSIAGLRVGYAAGNRRLIQYIENAQSTFNVNAAAILFATEILLRPDLMEAMRREEEEGHRWLAAALKEAGYRVFSRFGNYLLFFPRRTSGELVTELKEQGIWIRDYKRGVLNGWLRVSTGNIAAMRKFWDAFVTLEGSAKGEGR